MRREVQLSTLSVLSTWIHYRGMRPRRVPAVTLRSTALVLIALRTT